MYCGVTPLMGHLWVLGKMLVSWVLSLSNKIPVDRGMYFILHCPEGLAVCTGTLQ